MSDLTLAFRVPGDPIAKARARATSIGGFTRVYTPTRSKDFEHLVMLAAQANMGQRTPLDIPLSVVVEFHLSIPSSFSQKKQRECLLGAVMPTGKPDLDNLVKSTLDGMLRVVFRDDACVCNLIVSKRYSVTPCTWVRVETLDAVSARPSPQSKSVAPGQMQIAELKREPF